jgi:hypothetical protein
MPNQGGLLSKTLVIGIIFLFITSTVSPMVIGDNVRIKDESQVTVFEDPLGVEWSRIYGRYGTDFGNSARQTKDGGYIIVGTTTSYSPDGEYAAWLIKTDVIGNIEWYNTYGEDGILNIDVAYSVEQTDDGGYIFTGNTLSYGAIGSDLWLVKTDNVGNEEWNKIYGGKGRDHGYQVLQADDGGYVAAGYTDSYGAGSQDFYLLKTDSNGNEEWYRTYGGAESEGCWSVDKTDDGGYILTGVISSYAVGNHNLWLVKTDSNGVEEWNRTYGSVGAEANGNSVQQTSDSGYIVTGVKSVEGQGRVVLLLKTDSNGIMEWNKTFGEPSKHYWGNEVQQTNDGGYIIAVEIEGINIGDAVLIKTDANGSKEWDIKFEEDYDECFNSVQQTRDGGYIAGGWRLPDRPKEFYPDFWLVKVGHVPDIEVTKPENAVYLFNKKRASFFRPFIVGPIDVEVDASDDEYEIEKVEFYVDDVFQANDSSEPYVWRWDKLMFFKHTLKAVVFNSKGNVGVEEIVVSKFF